MVLVPQQQAVLVAVEAELVVAAEPIPWVEAVAEPGVMVLELALYLEAPVQAVVEVAAQQLRRAQLLCLRHMVVQECLVSVEAEAEAHTVALELLTEWTVVGMGVTVLPSTVLPPKPTLELEAAVDPVRIHQAVPVVAVVLDTVEWSGPHE